MSSSSDTLRFCFPTHGDSILSKINALREQQRFCDITLVLGGPRGTTVQPPHFCGHRAVLAASSDFLRDQFLLHEGRAELSVGVFSSVEVGKRLLQSCYTGLLEVPLRELVSYLTAASALQMSQVVERCAQAVSQYLSPTLAFLKPEIRPAEEKDTRQLDSDRRDTSFRNQEERDSAQPTASSQESRTEEGGEVVIQSKSRFSQVAKMDELVDSSENQEEEAEGEQSKEEELFSLEAELQECGELIDSRLLCLSEAHLPKSHCSGDELTEGSDSVLIQRPYLCRRCDRVFQHLESYAGHLKQHRQYLCLVCGKGFSQRSNLARHTRVHTRVKPFRCPLCHKTFSHKATLQDHLNLHTGDKPHKCKYCAVLFQHKPGLRRHLKDIHGKSSLQNMLEEAVHSYCH
ncbi:zinc finger and BTB domain-containing protein 26-like [Anoplopoma fimbria]|uniref:zinc finger and BTB domain-containing protein 26-like n=1 Tax=Anoplopoma fimbria TaxID=229290 RepID=UPI0023ED75D7|nr:zinc finger and BTB domain-containing protein 26-like [Anoplopoma fimbria]